jgi:AspT/YidE/YbjL antiporter-like protein
MNWFTEIFSQHTFIQAILVISGICAAGLALGKINIFGISLGATFVFFAGILAGHFGLSINPDMLAALQNFGLILFIYALGVQVGPGFFASLKKGGFRLNMLATLLILTGTAGMLITHWITGISLIDMMGLFSGAVTNTPMLGAARQALLQIDPGNTDGVNNMAMACAVGYPFGLIGAVLCVALMKAFFGKNTTKPRDDSRDNAYVAEYHVSNPAIFGKSIFPGNLNQRPIG